MVILVKHPKLLFDKIFTSSLEGLKLIAYAVIILVINIAINPNANIELIKGLLIIFVVLFFFGVIISVAILYDLYLQIEGDN